MDNILGTASVFTTGQIARILGVNINTVVKWFESDKLKSYKLPGSNARRIPRAELIVFLSKCEYPMVAPRPEAVEILLASRQQSLVKCFRRAMKSVFGYNLRIASCAFEAGAICARVVPQAIFVHLEYSDFDPEEFFLSVRRRPQLAPTRLIAVTSARLDGEALARKGFEGSLHLPASKDAILDVIDMVVAKCSRSAVRFSKGRYDKARAITGMNRKYIVRLSKEEREKLRELVSEGTVAAQQINRANILLKADANDETWTDEEIAGAFGVCIGTVFNARRRFVLKGLEWALYRKKRMYPAGESILDGEKQAQLVALSRSEPPEGHMRWTLRLLAEKLMELGIIKSISHETVRQALRKLDKKP